jgi:hypothetical protein
MKSSRDGHPAPIANTTLAQPTKVDIARRAYQIYLARGGSHGCDLHDWLQAERELKAYANKPLINR